MLIIRSLSVNSLVTMNLVMKTSLLIFIMALLSSCVDKKYVNSGETKVIESTEVLDNANESDAALDLQEINLLLEKRRLEMEALRQQEENQEDVLELKPQYPTAEVIAGREGFVSSPYTGKILNVKGIEAGQLVNDPDYPKSSKKFFYIP